MKITDETLREQAAGAEPSSRRRRVNARLILMGVLPLLVIVIGAAGATLLYVLRQDVETRPPPRLAPLVRTETVVHRAVQIAVRSQGTVQPRTEGTLVPEVSGVVIAASPSWGDGGFFAAREVLLKIDPRDYELALVRARAQIEQAKLRLAEEEEEARAARVEWETHGRVDKKPSSLLLREPQLAEAKAALAAAKAAEEQAQRDLERTSIRAPYAGRIWEKSVDIGQYVTRSSPVARIYAVDRAEIRLPLPDEELAYLDVPLDYRDCAPPGAAVGGTPSGPQVRLRARFAGTEHTWWGRVTRTEAEINPRSRMVHVVAEVEDPYGRSEDAQTQDRPPLAVGLFVEAEILGRILRDVVVLPRHALREQHASPARLAESGSFEPHGARDRKTSTVLVVDEESRLRFRPVEVLRGSGHKLYPVGSERAIEGVVITKGLEAGEKVCVSLLDVVVEGKKVRLGEDPE